MLKGGVIGIDDEDDSTFTITVDQNRSYYFQGDYNSINTCNVTMLNCILKTLLWGCSNLYICKNVCSTLMVYLYVMQLKMLMKKKNGFLRWRMPFPAETLTTFVVLESLLSRTEIFIYAADQVSSYEQKNVTFIKMDCLHWKFLTVCMLIDCYKFCKSVLVALLLFCYTCDA